MFEIWDILRPLVKFALYPAMFIAAGGLMFELVFAAQLADGMKAYMRRLITAAAWAGLVLVAAQVMVAAGSLGGDMASATDTAIRRTPRVPVPNQPDTYQTLPTAPITMSTNTPAHRNTAMGTTTIAMA